MSRSRAFGLVAFATASVLQAQPASMPSHPYRPGIDVLDYELTIDLPDSGRNIEGHARLTVRRSPKTDTLVLDLLSMRVDSVTVNGARTSFDRDTRTVRIPLAPAAGDSLVVSVRYRGEPLDGLIIGADSLGRWMAFGDNFPDRGRNWIPSVDHPSDKATVTWIVRAPSERRVVANGVLLEETPLPPGASGRARTLTRWRTTRPIPVYLMVLAAAPLAYYDLGRTACGLSEMPGCVPQAVYVSPELRDYLPGPFARAAEIVEYFSRLVGPYPYEKLAHLQSSTRFGGMENASAIFYSDRAFRRRSLRPGLIAHEAAHQWFGDAVTEREWGHIWLSEGFASYFEQLWVERFTGDSAFRDGMTRLREQIIASPVTRERPVIDTAQTEYLKLLNTNSYQKGAWTLHMLRGLIGDSAFFGGIRSYYAKYRHGTALTDDLRREMERTSGMELGWFFDQWLRRPGFADVAVTWRHDPRTRRIVATVRQTGDFLPYRFALAVDVTDAAGRTSRLTVTVPAERETRLVLPLELSAAPKAVVLDANVGVLGKLVIAR